MEGRREDVEISPSPFFSVVSPPREIDSLSQTWPLPGMLRRQNGRSAAIRFNKI